MLMIYLANVGYTVSCQGIVQLGGPVPWCNRVGPAKVWLVSLKNCCNLHMPYGCPNLDMGFSCAQMSEQRKVN